MSSLNLKNFLQSIKRDKLLLLALLLGLLLRSLNPTFGSPALFISNDEAIAHLSAFNMIANKTLVSIANYTPFGAYVQIPFLLVSFILMQLLGLVTGVSDFEFFVLANPGYFLFIPRLISALFGVLLILVIYKITLNLFNTKRAALISAFLTAVSFNLVHISNTGRPWSAMLFFASLAIYNGLKKKESLSLLFLAIAFGFHQGAILVLPILFLLNEKWKLGYLLKVFVFIIFILFLNSFTAAEGLVSSINNNQSFLLAHRFLADLIVGNKDLVHSASVTLRNNLSIYYFKNLLVTDVVIVIFGLLGFVLTYSWDKRFKLILLYIFGYYIFASLFFHPLIRYLLPLFIILIPFSGLAISRLLKYNILVVFIALASVNSFWWLNLYVQKPTFVQAQEWVNKNLPSSTPLVYTGGRFYYFSPNLSSASYMQSYSDNSFKRLVEINQFNSKNVRSIIFLNKIPGLGTIDKIKKVSSEFGVAYVIDYYLDPKESLYFNYPNLFTLTKRFNPTVDGRVTGIAEPLFDASSNFDAFESRKNGSMYDLERVGPYFDILKLKPV